MQGRKALVTGGGRGIGKAIAARLAREGADVTILGRNAETLARTAGEIGCHYLTVDIRNTDAFVSAIASVGSLDILVNNAGTTVAAPFRKQTLADLNELLSVNLASAFVSISAVLPQMIARGWGRIVNIASTAGLKGYGYSAAYCASKHGLIGLTRALATEFPASGVTINAVCPGMTATDMASEAAELIAARSNQTLEEATARLYQFNPQKRLIDPEEVADAVAYLCGDLAKGMTGQALIVAGGEIM